MSRCWRQASNRCNQRVALQRERLAHASSCNQFCQSRSAGHRRHATLGFESDLSDPPSAHLQSQPQHVSTNRIFNVRYCVGGRKLPGIARILKVIEQLGRIHAVEIVTAQGRPFCQRRHPGRCRPSGGAKDLPRQGPSGHPWQAVGWSGTLSGEQKPETISARPQ